MKLLIIPVLALVAQQALADERVSDQAMNTASELNLSDNAQYITWTDVTGAVSSAVGVVGQFGSDVYNKTKQLAKKYGPDMWTAALEYGPTFVNWVLANQEKISTAANAVQDFNERINPKPAADPAKADPAKAEAKK